MLANRLSYKKLLVFLFALVTTLPVDAQCAMCRAQLESMDDNSMAEGINNGIIVLMAAPYILVGIVGFVIYNKFIKKKI